ncbi:MAG: cation-translocating P-type ATPase C-terminal domain-containing protein, partial [Prevotella sp.]|nr:cation-translocating P-type ATPase C-terminal domain-containing protein [Prevotella sp.]
AMALASLPPTMDVMCDKPRAATDFIIPRAMGRAILATGILLFAVMFVFLVYCERGNGVDVHELTLFFTVFVMMQWWNLLNAKALGTRQSAFHGLRSDRTLLMVMGVVLAGQWIIVTFGGKMFRTVPLSLTEWVAVIVATSPVLWVGEAIRKLKNK